MHWFDESSPNPREHNVQFYRPAEQGFKQD